MLVYGKSQGGVIKVKRIRTAVAIIAIIIMIMPTIVYADFGPKPSLNIYIKNNSQKTYYLTIMEKSQDIQKGTPDNMYIYEDGNWSTFLIKTRWI